MNRSAPTRQPHGSAAALAGVTLMLAAHAALAVGPFTQADPWADHVAYAVDSGTVYHQPGVAPGGDNLTHGPYLEGAIGPWADPEAVLGEPNSLDRDDFFTGGPWPGPMRQLNVTFAPWFAGTSDPGLLGQVADGTPNGVGLARAANGPGFDYAQLVVEFDERVFNNPAIGGASADHHGVDLIVHGNAFFGIDGQTAVGADANYEQVTVFAGILAEPMRLSVAQHADGPWYTFEDGPFADSLYPTQPWKWDWDNDQWSTEMNDWTKPVDPTLTLADFTGRSVAEIGDLYDGSAGGTGFDLDLLVDEFDQPVDLDWIRYVRIELVQGDEFAPGEVTAVIDAGPVLGDFDGDNDVDTLDLELLGANLGDPAFELDRVNPAAGADAADVRFFIEVILGTFRGDLDLDGDVDDLDTAALRANFGLAGPFDWTDGDLDFDDDIDINDAAILASNYGLTVAGAAPAAPIPEPAAAVLLAALLPISINRSSRHATPRQA